MCTAATLDTLNLTLSFKANDFPHSNIFYVVCSLTSVSHRLVRHLGVLIDIKCVYVITTCTICTFILSDCFSFFACQKKYKHECFPHNSELTREKLFWKIFLFCRQFDSFYQSVWIKWTLVYIFNVKLVIKILKKYQIQMRK